MTGSIARRATAAFGILCSALMLAVPGIAAAQGLTKVADNVYAYVGAKNSGPANSFGANAGVIVTDDGLIVVDTLISAKAATKFLDDIRAISDKPVKYAIDTHYHLDHSFGNDVYAKAGALVIGHRNTRAELMAHGAEVFENLSMYGMTPEDVAGTVLHYPDIVFKDRMTIYLGGQEVDLMYLGHTHSADSIVVYLPKQKLLFAGDALFTDYHVYLAEGDLEQWAKALDVMRVMDVDTIIPGHGPVSHKDDLRAMKEYLALFDGKAKVVAATGVGLDEAAAEMERVLPPRPEGGWLIKANLMMKYMPGVK